MLSLLAHSVCNVVCDKIIETFFLITETFYIVINSQIEDTLIKALGGVKFEDLASILSFTTFQTPT